MQSYLSHFCQQQKQFHNHIYVCIDVFNVTINLPSPSTQCWTSTEIVCWSLNELDVTLGSLVAIMLIELNIGIVEP